MISSVSKIQFAEFNTSRHLSILSILILVFKCTTHAVLIWRSFRLFAPEIDRDRYKDFWSSRQRTIPYCKNWDFFLFRRAGCLSPQIEFERLILHTSFKKHCKYNNYFYDFQIITQLSHLSYCRLDKFRQFTKGADRGSSDGLNIPQRYTFTQ